MIYFSHSVVGYLCNCTNCDQGGHPERPHIRSHTATGYWFTTCREQIFLEINIIITNIVITKDLAVALTISHVVCAQSVWWNYLRAVFTRNILSRTNDISLSLVNIDKLE